MKRILLIAAIVILGIVCFRKCNGGGNLQNSGTPINGYVGTVRSVSGNVLTLTSGLQETVN